MTLERVKERSFREQVLQSNQIPVVVFFTAGFCESSQRLVPMMDDLAKAYSGRARVVHMDVGDSQERARANKVIQRYKISRLPLTILFTEGTPKDYIGGIPSRENLVDMIDRRLQSVLEVGAHNFRREVLESKVPVLVHFHSGDCAESKSLSALVESTGERFRGRAKVVRVEANAFNAQVCAEYGAIRFPMLATFEGGEMRDCMLGPVTDEVMREAGFKDLSAGDHVAEMLEAALL